MRLMADGVDFHYVSGAPWQLYRALDQFLIEESGFPEGTFHMKNVPKNLAEAGDLAGVAQSYRWRLYGRAQEG